MNTNEAAKAMIEGEIGILGNHEYKWHNCQFWYYNKIYNAWYSLTNLKDSESWEIKTDTIKYSKDIWLAEVPNSKGWGDSIPTYLFGDKYFCGASINRRLEKHRKKQRSKIRIYDVLACLSIDYSEDFHDFCEMFDLSTDSRNALALYEGIRTETRNLKKLWPTKEEQEKLNEIA